MRYRKIKGISMKANSPRNLVLRQQFALRLLGLNWPKKVIINIDESWIGMSDFRKYKWSLPNSTNSIRRLQIIPRISLILALDSTGKVYFSLL